MHQKRADYQAIPYPKYQQFQAVAARSMRYKPMIHGLLEVDVTRPRAVLREHKAKTGESLSFTAYLAACLAKAIDEDKAVQAFRRGRNQLVLFEDVDISTRIERDVGGQKYVMQSIIRAANRKSFSELHHEIRAAQKADSRHILMQYRLFTLFPPPLYTPFIWTLGRIGRRWPRLWKMTMGTVGLTSVGMFGKGSGWGIPASSPTALLVTVGGIGEKQVLMDGHVAAREYLSLTISVDHDLIDGAPAARFTQRLKELIEGSYGLDASTHTAEQPQRIGGELCLQR